MHLLVFGVYMHLSSAYDMEDTYTQPFKRAIEVGGAGGVMYACNKVNGIFVLTAQCARLFRNYGEKCTPETLG